jgi:hypothetical protein
MKILNSYILRFLQTAQIVHLEGDFDPAWDFEQTNFRIMSTLL